MSSCRYPPLLHGAMRRYDASGNDTSLPSGCLRRAVAAVAAVVAVAVVAAAAAVVVVVVAAAAAAVVAACLRFSGRAGPWSLRVWLSEGAGKKLSLKACVHALIHVCPLVESGNVQARS